MQNRSRWAWLLLSALVLTLLLAGCGGGGGGDSSLDRIKKAGQIVVAVDDTYPPMEFHDENDNNKLVGFDVDLMEEIAKRLGVTVKWEPTAWDGIIPGLQSRKYDSIISSMNITEERSKAVDFSDAYLELGQVVLVQKGNPKNITKLDDLKGARIAVQIGTTNEEAARGIEGAEVTVFDTFPMAMEEVASGRADACIADTPYGKYYVAHNPDKADVAPFEIEPMPVGIAFHQEDDQLREEVNKILKAIKDDGTFDQIKAKWFGNG